MNSQLLTVLLVEDNEDHAELIKRNLEDYSHSSQLYHMKDGEEALNYLTRQGEYSDPETSPRPDLILLDLRLPKIDGLSVLKEIKESQQLRIIPTVILTSSESESDICSAYKNYVNSFLVKPLDGLRFSQLMREIGGYWLENNTNAIAKRKKSM